MKNLRKRFVPTSIIGLCLLLSLLASCGRDKGQENAGAEGIAPPPVIEPYTGPCPAGQSSWDCMAWNTDKWE